MQSIPLGLEPLAARGIVFARVRAVDAPPSSQSGKHSGPTTIELVSLRTLGATGLANAPGSAPGGSGIYRHGVEIAVSGSYLKMLNYVGQLERLPAKIFWGNMDLQAGAYPQITLKITLYTLSPDKTWLLI